MLCCEFNYVVSLPEKSPPLIPLIKFQIQKIFPLKALRHARLITRPESLAWKLYQVKDLLRLLQQQPGGTATTWWRVCFQAIWRLAFHLPAGCVVRATPVIFIILLMIQCGH